MGAAGRQCRQRSRAALRLQSWTFQLFHRVFVRVFEFFISVGLFWQLSELVSYYMSQRIRRVGA